MNDSEGSKQNKVILVIDDDLDVRILLEKFLFKEGYTVLLASSGQEGLDLFDANSCYAILLDVSLGDINGIEVAKRMRWKKGNDFKIIGMTAYSKSTIEERYPEASTFFNQFCFKPFLHKDVIELLKN